MTESRNWRLLPYSIHDGITNMAIDEAILEAHLKGLVPPTLRLYGFQPAAITVGYNQKLPDYVEQRASEKGIDIARRPTGGRAVLHLNDLTYSFIGTSEHAGEPHVFADTFLQNSILGAYKQICHGLELALKYLGLEVESGELSVPYKHLHDCFLATTGSDLHYKGKKLIGSAQLRRRWAVLQHGSLLLNQAQSIMPELLAVEDSKDANVDRHANLFDILGKELDMQTLQKAFQKGFETAFNASFSEQGFVPEEIFSIAQLREKQLNTSGSLASSHRQ